MKTTYFLVLLLALALIPEDVNGWFFRRVRLSFVRKLRVNPYHTGACFVACRWPSSWACKICKRKRGLDVAKDQAEPQEDELIMNDLDVDGDGFVELPEVAKVTGIKVTNSALIDEFNKADANADGKLNLNEFEHFNFEDHKELMDAFDEDDKDAAGGAADNDADVDMM